ncbi:MAG TPA: methyltransferase domain-containing protein [Candidatus Angelobacter sp.]
MANLNNSFATFPDVDRAANAGQLVHYLKAVSSLEMVKKYKRSTYDLLNLRRGEHVLEVGCGAGDDARALAQLVGKEGRVVGLDLSQTMIAEAQAKSAGNGGSLEFRQGDAQKLPFSDFTFDACRVDRVLQHLEAPERAIAEMTRVLKLGGRIAAAEPDWDTLVIEVPERSLARRIVHHKCDSARQGWIGRRLKNLFCTAGLADVSVDAHTLVLTELPLADQFIGIRSAAANAASDGAISAEEAALWRQWMDQAASNGSFFCSLTGFSVKARKP